MFRLLEFFLGAIPGLVAGFATSVMFFGSLYRAKFGISISRTAIALIALLASLLTGALLYEFLFRYLSVAPDFQGWVLLSRRSSIPLWAAGATFVLSTLVTGIYFFLVSSRTINPKKSKHRKWDIDA